NAHWTQDDETRLIAYLLEHKSEAGDGFSFKNTTWNGASTELNKHITKGGFKTAMSCKNKWGKFRKIFNVIQGIKNRSGGHWSDETGASITPLSASSWDDYVVKHPQAKQFRNQGWVHLHDVEQLMPSTPRGKHV
ncbi:hypothetical protein BD779DRAFT_1389539, partial [Infundibulicybe gibba]